MNAKERLSQALAAIDQANTEDPRTDLVDGERCPRELNFSRRMSFWVKRLVENPSEQLLLATRAFAIRRWKISRDQYPMTTVGYHQWRNTLAQFHAEQTQTLLHAAGYPDPQIKKITDLITKKNWPGDDEACALEDASCLAFLEVKLCEYLDTWDKDKMLRILSGSIRKMTPAARTMALELDLPQRGRELLLEARELAVSNAPNQAE